MTPRDDGTIRVIVAGTREFNDYDLVKKELDKLRIFPEFYHGFTVFSGCAKGADQLGERYAYENHLQVVKFPADWEKYGKKAGPIRNEEMAKHADACIVFWNGKSKGTKNMIDNAKKYKLRLIVVGVPPYGLETVR